MNSLDTGKDKIKKICEILTTETLEPAKEQAASIIEQAESKARSIVQAAEEKSKEILAAAAAKNSKERQVFETSLKQACQQGMEELRQDIETKLLNVHLAEWLNQQMADPAVCAKLVGTLVGAIEKEGTAADFSALIPKTLKTADVNALLAKDILEKLKEKSVTVGEFMGGVQLKLHEQKLTLDVSSESVQELLKRYLQKDFRDIIFGE